MKSIQISVSDFAIPTPREGSIETYSGYGALPNWGVELHQHWQEQQLEQNSEYQAEKWISYSFEVDEYRLTIGGRMDGFLPAAHDLNKTTSEPTEGSEKASADKDLIEEIKTGFGIEKLKEKLLSPLDHPFKRQLGTYCFLQSLYSSKPLGAHFVLICARTKKVDLIEYVYDEKEMAQWFERRIEQVILEQREFEKKVAQRKKKAAQSRFPFSEPRTGQLELITWIEQHLSTPQGKESRLMVQAPTGLGKTMGVLFPVLKESLARGQKTIYVTPKNSQFEVCENAIETINEKLKEKNHNSDNTPFNNPTQKTPKTINTSLKSLTLHSKAKMCLMKQVQCDPKLCPYAKDHYTKVEQHQLAKKLKTKKTWSAKLFKDLGEKFAVCPYELQSEALLLADLIICDYNYVFSPYNLITKLNRSGLGKSTPPNLIIDEAHNLPDRANDYFSARLEAREIKNKLKTIEDNYPALADLCIKISSHWDQFWTKIAAGLNEVSQVNISPSDFFPILASSRELQTRHLESVNELEAQDPVLQFFMSVQTFADLLLNSSLESVVLVQPQFGQESLRYICLDSGPWLKSIYSEFKNTVAFSATLKPFDYFSTRLGMVDGFSPEEVDQNETSQVVKYAEFHSPFPKENRKLLIIPQISTTYKDRAQNLDKIVQTIEKLTSLKKGNYFAFFPSYEFMQQTASRLAPEGYRLIVQSRDLSRHQVADLRNELENSQEPLLVLAVQGGVLSEGVDYPGDMVIGAFIVGPSLPHFDFERECLRRHYDQKLQGKGFQFAYTYPAMARVVQSAGRVIRSAEDRGLIVLMDRRFLFKDYQEAMPLDWLEAGVEGLQSREIIKDIQHFWNQAESAD